jgi:hypothetical protein
MTEKITFGDLRRLLEACSFDRTPVSGPYVVYKHSGAGAVQAFRAHRVTERADPMTLESVRKTLVGFGIVAEDEYEEALRVAAVERSAKARRE